MQPWFLFLKVCFSIRRVVRGGEGRTTQGKTMSRNHICSCIVLLLVKKKKAGLACTEKLIPMAHLQLQLNKPAVASSTTQSVSVQQQTQAQMQTTQASQQQKAQDYVPIASNDPALTNYTIQRNSVNGWVAGSPLIALYELDNIFMSSGIHCMYRKVPGLRSKGKQVVKNRRRQSQWRAIWPWRPYSWVNKRLLDISIV